MKTNPAHLSTLMALATLAFIAPVTTKAQTPSTSSSSNSQQSCPWQHHNGWAKLSEAERSQLKADMVKIHGNPKLVAAGQVVKNDLKTLHQTKRELLLQADPSVKPILNKIAHEERWAHVTHWFRHLFHSEKYSNHPFSKRGEIWEKLSEAERSQLKADMVKVHGNQKLVAARQVVENDMKTLRQIRRELLLQADPSIKPVLDKIDQAKECHSQKHCGNHKSKE
jgi:hypothetical protein